MILKIQGGQVHPLAPPCGRPCFVSEFIRELIHVVAGQKTNKLRKDLGFLTIFTKG